MINQQGLIIFIQVYSNLLSMIYENDSLPYCRTLIEQKVGWGSSELWQNSDFEELSKLILTKTGVSLSVSTLKRIWGRVKYDSSPTPATLDTLARFVDFENWRSLRLGHQPSFIPADPVRLVKIPVFINSKLVFMAVLIGLAILLCALLSIWSKKETLVYDKINFTSRFVAKSIPNTTVFQYDVSNSNADSVFIQQSWDPALRFPVSKKGKYYTSTYYYPGYYRAKLILNDSIVREHDLFITSNGWLGTVDRPTIPLYMNADVVEKQNKIISVTESDLKTIGIQLQNDAPSVSLFKVDSTQINPGKQFVFETAVQSTYSNGDGVCQMVDIELLCTEGSHVIPLSTPGCVGKLNLVVSNEEIDGITNDLSGFGVDFKKWVSVRYEVAGKQGRIFINNDLVYQRYFESTAGKVVGFRYRFTGTGAIKYARIK